METNTKLTRGPIYRFTQYAPARDFTEHARKPCLIVLGDDEKFWVVTAADATRLQRLGYELAP